eukprot:GHVS01011081.1.p1 GENE.GHVS01011081.1~~GHVS01011081.1.p1  ORF type:complete len:280 (+),score=22.50 GHVS01011081.1:54-893(+)
MAQVGDGRISKRDGQISKRDGEKKSTRKIPETTSRRTYPNLADSPELLSPVFSSPCPKPNSVEANIELLQDMRAGLCPRVGPHPLVIAAAVAGEEGSQPDLVSVLCETVSYADTTVSTAPKTSNTQLIQKRLKGIMSRSVCYGCEKSLRQDGKETSDKAFVLSLPVFDPTVATAWIDRLMIVCGDCKAICSVFHCMEATVNSLSQRRKINQEEVCGLASSFMMANAHDMGDMHKFQQAVEVAYSLSILCKEIRWKFCSHYPSVESLLDSLERTRMRRSG